MGGNRNDRDTRDLDKDELARLARESVDVVEIVSKPPVDDTDISSSRTATLHDPMTMALLAEVARNARTREFDPTDMPSEKPETEQLPHPNLKRR
jgi:hypothetical protein